RSFLGLACYYKRFVERFSSVASPLTVLTQKKVKFIWFEACEKSFHELKDKLTSTSALPLPKKTNGFVVCCNTSRIRLGCVFMKKDYNISVLYHPGKENVVADALSQLSMGSVAHVEDNKKKFVRDVHIFSQLGVWLVNSTKGGAMVHNDSESYFVTNVKAKQGLDPTLVELKEPMLKRFVESFYQWGDSVIRYQHCLYVPM
ncbi:hypothetical protein MTR67_051888, partial [Solanum verrucosum]